MNVTNKVIPFRNVWTTLPNMQAILDYPRPIRPALNEDVVLTKLTEAQLREAILSTTTSLGNGVLDAAAINALPDGYVTSLYHHIRYGLPPQDGIFPLRSAENFSSSVHAVPALILMTRLIYSMYVKNAKSIEPLKLQEADNLLRLQRYLEYALWSILRVNPTADRGTAVVFSAQTVTNSVGSGEDTYSESTYVVYLDEQRQLEYAEAGMTAQEIAQYWFDNKQQPPMPEDD